MKKFAILSVLLLLLAFCAVVQCVAAPITATYVSATSFTVSGSQTATFATGYTVTLFQPYSGIKTATISGSSYSAGTGLTTVVVGTSVVASDLQTVTVSAATSGGGTWGSITGTLANQTDLATVLATIPNLASPGPIGLSVPNAGYFTSVAIGTTNAGFSSTGIVSGAINQVPVRTNTTLTAAQCMGSTVTASATASITIPAGLSAGANFTVVVGFTGTVKIVPPSGGSFLLNGVAQTANYILTSTGVAGDSVYIEYNGTNFVVFPTPTCPWTAAAT